MSKLAKTVRPLGFFTIDEVLPHVGESHMCFLGHDGKCHRMYMNHKKLQVFAKSGGVCVACGLRPSHFVLYHDPDQAHSKFRKPFFTLYARTGAMMTIDHILPRSKGGSDEIENLQCMCDTCNKKKSNDENWTYKRPLSHRKAFREAYFAW